MKSAALAALMVAISWSLTSARALSAGAARVPTFTKDVAPILFKSCASCHRPGEIAPMSLLTYAEARPWARAIKQKVVSREMPPWYADPHFSPVEPYIEYTIDSHDLTKKISDR